MKIGILGTGMVGKALGAKLAGIGHEVRMGSRKAGGEAATAWARGAGARASEGTFAEAARFGDPVFNCTAGTASLEALRLAGEENLAGKVLVDVANPLDFSRGRPPLLTVCNTDSLGEQIQHALPGTRVVKTLNTVNCNVMVDPGLLPGDHHLFVCGNDAGAKARVADLLVGMGWKRRNLVDLGDITAARATEMLLPLWLRVSGVLGTPHFSFRVVAP